MPTVPSNITVEPSDFNALNHDAVPELLALESWTIALNVNTPATATGAASVLKRNSASNTCAPSAVSAVAGCHAREYHWTM